MDNIVYAMMHLECTIMHFTNMHMLC